jgi:RHH-type transcriptional regulator, rel operon repressor / antitoxin RelB
LYYRGDLMLSVRLPAKMEKKLASLAKKTGRTKSFYVQRALAQNFEDMEDIYLADQSRNEILAGGVLLSQDEVDKLLGW